MQSVVRTETYSYDAVDQVTGVDYGNARTEGFVYDAVGNRISSTDSAVGTTSYTTNALNQYVSLSVNSVSSVVNYDSRGNLAAQGVWTYTYDSKNRLLSAVSSGLGVNLSQTYDCHNKVVSRTLNGTTRYFIYDGWSLIAECNSTGDLVEKYVHGVVIDELLVKTRGTTDAFYHHDALGSTVLLTNASGSVVRSYEYDAFGKVSNPPVVDGMFSADPYANRFLYTGREFLQEVGLYDYRNRVYSAELGRFLQSDPIRFDAGDVNLYRYVANRASRSNDPYGLEEECCPEGSWSGKGTYAGAGAIIGFGWFDGEMKCDSKSSLKATVRGRMWPFGLTVGAGVNSLELSASGAKKKADLIGQTGVFVVLGAGSGASIEGGTNSGIGGSIGFAAWGWKIREAK